MGILAIDTSSHWCSVAFLFADRQLVRHELLSNQASQMLLPWIHELMQANSLSWDAIERIAVSIGPGAFTGIRLGVGIAQGIAYARAKPLIPITSMDGMMAYQYMTGNRHVRQNGYMIAAIDARMGQWYWGVYQTFKDRMPIRADAIALSEPSLIHVQSTKRVLGHQLTLGEEIGSHLQIISGEVSPHALGIASLALQADLSGSFLAKDCQPLYIRDRIAQTILERSTPGL